MWGARDRLVGTGWPGSLSGVRIWSLERITRGAFWLNLRELQVQVLILNHELRCLQDITYLHEIPNRIFHIFFSIFMFCHFWLLLDIGSYRINVQGIKNHNNKLVNSLKHIISYWLSKLLPICLLMGNRFHIAEFLRAHINRERAKKK